VNALSSTLGSDRAVGIRQQTGVLMKSQLRTSIRTDGVVASALDKCFTSEVIPSHEHHERERLLREGQVRGPQLKAKSAK